MHTGCIGSRRGVYTGRGHDNRFDSTKRDIGYPIYFFSGFGSREVIPERETFF
jgi:hypothetical protein